jgi:hypothetical protein
VDDPVKQYNPDLTFSDPWVTDHVTFADLYSHRSGLPGGFGNGAGDDGLHATRSLPPPVEPVPGVVLLQQLRHDGGRGCGCQGRRKSFEDMVHEQLFGPAGMTETSPSYDDFLARDNRATIHAKIQGEWMLGPPRMPDAQAPAGGVTTSVKDLATWTRLVLAGGTLDGTSIIDEAARGETHVPHIVRSPLGSYDAESQFYGLGWNVEDDHLGFLRWVHSGAFTNGTGTTAVLLLDGDTFTVARYPELPDGKDLVAYTMGSDGTASSMDIGDSEGPAPLSSNASPDTPSDGWSPQASRRAACSKKRSVWWRRCASAAGSRPHPPMLANAAADTKSSQTGSESSSKGPIVSVCIVR